MKNKNVLCTAVVLLLLSATSCQQLTGPVLKDDKDTASYAYGVYLGKGLVNQDITFVDPELMKRGMADVLGEKNDTMTAEQAQFIMVNFYQKIEKQKKMEEFGENLRAGEEFLEKNKEQEGVMVTESGVQYKVIAMGTGPVPGLSDIVHVRYTGSVVDGTVFDSTEGKEPVIFGVGGVIPGWKEILQMMPEGSKWMIYIPQELGYGDQEMARGIIQPFSTLIFEIELLKVEPRGEEK